VEKLAFNIGREFWLKEGLGIGQFGQKCVKWEWDAGRQRCIEWKGEPTYSSIGSFISAILPNFYVIAGVIAFVLVLIAGLMFIINAGKGESEQAKKWQGTLTASVAGLLIIFLSYWIIQIIEVITGIEIFNR